MNQYDGGALAAALSSAGLAPAEDADAPADLVVVNTCCVTATAMRKSRQAIRRAARRSPRAVVLVTGCYCYYDGRRVWGLLRELGIEEGRLFLAGDHEPLARTVARAAAAARSPHAPRGRSLHTPRYHAPRGHGPAMTASEAEPPAQGRVASHAGARLLRSRGTPQSLSDEAAGDEPLPGKVPGPREATPGTLVARRSGASGRAQDGPGGAPGGPVPARQRAFVKVQDGCDAFCAYCVVPYTRPNVSSRPPTEIVAECRNLVAAGHREIVLCGVFLGAYGRATAVRRRWSDGPAALADLLRRVGEIEGLWRVRLSSIEPGDVTDELLTAAGDLPTFAPHLHLPLQSGSDAILAAMNRQYRARDVLDAIGRLRDAFDRPAVTTDVIAGFAGESDADFARTLEVCREAGFAKIHAFPFSPIRGTPAWNRRRERPAGQTVRQRLTELAAVERASAARYRAQFVGETLEGIVEAPRPGRSRRRAMTDRYLPVRFAPPEGQTPDALTGRVVRLRITAPGADGLDGELAPARPGSPPEDGRFATSGSGQ